MEPQKNAPGQSSSNGVPDVDPAALPQNTENNVDMESLASEQPATIGATPDDVAAADRFAQDTSDAPEASPVAGQTIKPQDSASEAETGDSTDVSSNGGGEGGSDGPTAPEDSLSAVDAPPATPLPIAARKHGKKGLIIGLVVAATLLFLTGGAAATYYYILNKPENVLKQALANSLDSNKTKTAAFSGEATIEGEDLGTPITITYKGAGDSKTGAFELSGDVDVLVTKLTYDLRSADGKSLYLRAGGLDGVSELLAASSEVGALYAPVITAVNDQWIEVNESLIKEFDDSYESSTFTESDGKKIADAYQQHSFLVVREVLADETVGGQPSHHYKLVIDEAKLKSFVVALKDAKLDSYEISQEFVDELGKSLDDVNLEKYPFEVWISKQDKMFTRLALKTDDSGASLSATLTFDSYNKAVKVERPAGAKSLLEVMGDLYGETSGTDLSLPMQDLESGISL